MLVEKLFDTDTFFKKDFKISYFRLTQEVNENCSSRRKRCREKYMGQAGVKGALLS